MGLMEEYMKGQVSKIHMYKIGAGPEVPKVSGPGREDVSIASHSPGLQCDLKIS